MAEERIKVYPILPASTTGDLWHLASAAILNDNKQRSLKNPSGLHIIPVIFIYDEATWNEQQLAAEPIPDGNKEEVKKQREAGPMTFNFLKDLHLDCLLIVIKGSGMKNSAIQAMLYSMDDAFFDKLYATQASALDYSQLDWQKTIDLAKSHPDEPLYGFVPFHAASADIIAPIPGRRSLHYHAATTAAMMVLANASTRKEKLENLQIGLNPTTAAISGERLTTGQVDELAQEKLNDLLKYIKVLTMKDSHRIIIYNNRGNDVNAQTSSTTEVFAAFKTLVESDPYNMRIVVINTGGPDLGYQPVLDLFNKISNKPFPGLDPMVTCRFWNKLSKVAKDWRVFGMFSGRSGSCDVAAFNGLNCFYWDTPYLELAAYDAGVFRSFGFDRDEVREYEIRDVSKRVADSKAQEEQRKQIQAIRANPEVKDKNTAIKQLKAQLEAAQKPEAVKCPAGWDGARSGLKSEAANQMAQSYRTLQQFLIMAVGYPANVQNFTILGKAPWKEMTQNPLEKWLEGHSFLNTPLFPRCPEIPNLYCRYTYFEC